LFNTCPLLVEFGQIALGFAIVEVWIKPGPSIWQQHAPKRVPLVDK
jgi:hypothetical protein